MKTGKRLKRHTMSPIGSEKAGCRIRHDWPPAKFLYQQTSRYSDNYTTCSIQYNCFHQFNHRSHGNPPLLPPPCFHAPDSVMGPPPQRRSSLWVALKFMSHVDDRWPIFGLFQMERDWEDPTFGRSGANAIGSWN